MNFYGEIDIGWELQARRDDRNRAIRERKSWRDEEIIYNGRPEKRYIVINRLRAAISTYEDEGYDIAPITAAILKAHDLEPGEEIEFPKLEKTTSNRTCVG